jgi:hypothetical protein
MSEGELLIIAFHEALGHLMFLPNPGGLTLNVPYSQLRAVEQALWMKAAQRFLAMHGAIYGWRSIPGAIGPPDHNWKEALSKYGRHTADCGFSVFYQTPCTCGFAEIEKELAA